FMKRVVNLSVEERISQSGFSDEVLGDVISIYAVYECAKCGEKVRFERTDFEQKKDAATTNLNDTDHLLFIQSSNSSNARFLDFYCPKCRLPVRINFRCWAGGKADSGVSFLNVQEIIEST
ncbi:MAG: hypothetical protein ABIQ12_15795, partial [Opitutaceae bacterium]